MRVVFVFSQEFAIFAGGSGGAAPSHNQHRWTMKTNKDKLLRDAFVTFLQYNYERTSYAMLTEATGLSKAGMAYYYPTKQELFVAVADRFFFRSQNPDTKSGETDTLAEFIDHFIYNVRSTIGLSDRHNERGAGLRRPCPAGPFHEFHVPDTALLSRRACENGAFLRWRTRTTRACRNATTYLLTASTS